MGPEEAIKAIEKASKTAGSSTTKAVVDRITGFKISKWEAEGEVQKRQILDRYEEAKSNGVQGIKEAKELREAANLINTASRATQYMSEGSIPESAPPIDDDFFWNLVEHSKTVSEENVQELIASIMASEYMKPGQYSVRTLNVLRTLDKSDLEKFNRARNLLVSDMGIPSSFFEDVEAMRAENFGFSQLQDLQSAGLFKPGEVNHTLGNRPERMAVLYHGEMVQFKRKGPDAQGKLKFPDQYALTVAGTELLPHFPATKSDSYLDWLERSYKLPGYELE